LANLIILPGTAAAPGSSKRLEAIADPCCTSSSQGRLPCFYRCAGGCCSLVCSSSKRGRLSGGAFPQWRFETRFDGNGSAAGNRVRPHHTVKLYVGNISFTITEADLHQIFEQFGSVTELKVITDRETGQPRGFAFVTMSNEPEGRAAIKSLDGKEFGGRPLKVSEARPKEDRPTRSSSRPRR
jgi:cold-inducible RNA-binding protein